MRKIVLVLAAGMLTIAACKKDDKNNTPSTGPTARAMFVNATLHETSLDVKVNDTALSSVKNLTFLTNNGYSNLRAGNVAISFLRSSDHGEIAKVSSSIAANSSYSVFAVGNGTTGAPSSIVVVSDDLTAPASGMAKVRFANLSAEPNFSMTALLTSTTSGSQRLDSNITTKTITSYKEVTAGTYTITMADQNTFQSQSLSGQNLVQGKIYTYVFTGKDGATGNSAFKMTSFGNN